MTALPFQMPNIRPVYDTVACIMAGGPAAIYSFPTEEGNGIPVCLIFDSPHYAIEVMEDIIAVINELDSTYCLQLFPFRTEIHFSELDYFATVMICEVLTSVSHWEVGDWAFLPSEMGAVL